MSEPITLADLLKSVPTASSLSALSMLCVNTQGELQKMIVQSFAEAIAKYLFNPLVTVTNIDTMTTSGIYKVASFTIQGTLPDIEHANYGHLIVLARDTTVQQVFINRRGIALRFKVIGSDWEDWKLLVAA